MFFKYISDCYTNTVAVGQLSANMNRIIGTFQRITISKFKKEIESHVSSSFSFQQGEPLKNTYDAMNLFKK